MKKSSQLDILMDSIEASEDILDLFDEKIAKKPIADRSLIMAKKFVLTKTLTTKLMWRSPSRQIGSVAPAR